MLVASTLGKPVGEIRVSRFAMCVHEGIATHSCATPPQPERGLVRKKLAEAEHHAIDEREEKIDCSAAYNRPECRRLVEDDGRG